MDYDYYYEDLSASTTSKADKEEHDKEEDPEYELYYYYYYDYVDPEDLQSAQVIEPLPKPSYQTTGSSEA